MTSTLKSGLLSKKNFVDSMDRADCATMGTFDGCIALLCLQLEHFVQKQTERVLEEKQLPKETCKHWDLANKISYIAGNKFRDHNMNKTYQGRTVIDEELYNLLEDLRVEKDPSTTDSGYLYDRIFNFSPLNLAIQEGAFLKITKGRPKFSMQLRRVLKALAPR